jgi:hypothetical protein
MAMAHPFYMGVCELKYNEKEKNLQGTVKLFLNDLEDALKRTSGKQVDLINGRDSVAVARLLEDYVKKRFQLAVNGHPLNYKYLGCEKEEEALWLFIESDHCPRPRKLEIKCQLLYDFLKQQMNIFHIEVAGDKKSLKVQNPDKNAVFDFN